MSLVYLRNVDTQIRDLSGFYNLDRRRRDGSQFRTGDGATATATIATSPGPITGITVDNGGQGYLQVPTVTIDGDGSGATATATISDGDVTDITVDNGGADYTTATVTVESPEDANA